MNKKLRLLIILVVAVLLFAGCSSHDGKDNQISDDTTGGVARQIDDESDQITVTLTSVEDKWITEKAIMIGEKYGELPVPTKSGFVFQGWYDREYGGQRIRSDDMAELTEDATYYGQWQKYSREIGYDENTESEEFSGNSESSGRVDCGRTYDFANKLPILMYHWFYQGDGDWEQQTDNNWMPVSEFEEQMEYLHEEDFYFPTWREVEHYIDGELILPEKSVIVTVDDGKEDFFRLGIPILKKNDIKATSFLITSKMSKKEIDKYKKKYGDSSIDFRSHTENLHIRGWDNMGVAMSMTVDEIIKDLSTSGEKLGQAYVLCYPFGHVSDDLKEGAHMTGFDLAVTTEFDYATPGIDKMEIPRVRMTPGISIEAYKQIVE